jgi:hypothetical protein
MYGKSITFHPHTNETADQEYSAPLSNGDWNDLLGGSPKEVPGFNCLRDLGENRHGKGYVREGSGSDTHDYNLFAQDMFEGAIKHEADDPFASTDVRLYGSVAYFYGDDEFMATLP